MVPNSTNEPAPGESCGSGKVYDCALNCVNAATASSWIGDGYCDDGTWGMVLTCPEFNNDGCDCGGDGCGDGGDCPSGEVADCVGNCVNAATASSWTGDGYCDDGTWGMFLQCPAFNNDGDDCALTVNPTVAQGPMAGPPGTTFVQWGTDFTPNSIGIFHVRKPDGTEYDPFSISLDNIGHFEINYTAPSNKPPGTYTWWVIDGPTGTKSNEVSYVIY